MIKKYYASENTGIGGQSVYVVINDSESKLLRHIVRHSPDGFQWGYGGSGAADLALSILTDYFNGDVLKAEKYYMKFKRECIALLPTNISWIIDVDAITLWIRSHADKN